jgi:hypothetical protein
MRSSCDDVVVLAQLWDAARRGDTAEAGRLFAAGADINSKAVVRIGSCALAVLLLSVSHRAPYCARSRAHELRGTGVYAHRGIAVASSRRLAMLLSSGTACVIVPLSVAL